MEDAAEAYRLATTNGARGCLQPTTLHCESSGQDQTVAEVELYGDVRLRFVSGSFQVREQRPALFSSCKAFPKTSTHHGADTADSKPLFLLATGYASTS